MNFIAIDFETANRNHASPCEIGIAVFRNGTCEINLSRKIHPPKKYFYFDSEFTKKHGITKEVVQNEPEFPDIYKILSMYFDKNLILAHNASFDIDVLKKTLEFYGLPYPSFTYNCTMWISKQVWPKLVDHKLSTVAGFLGISFIHHKAAEDAKACAEIAHHACIEKNVTTLEELEYVLRIPRKTFPENLGFVKSSRKISMIELCIQISPNNSYATKNIPSDDELAKSRPFDGKLVVITGELNSISRDKVEQIIRISGGKCSNNISRKTDYLVIGARDPQKYKGKLKSGKLEKADDLISQGYPLKEISENDFLSMLRR